MSQPPERPLPLTLLRAWRRAFVNRPQPFAVQQPDGTYRWVYAECDLEELRTHLDGEWTLAFHAGRGAPEAPIRLSNLTDWSKSEDPRIRYFSGTATYAKRFDFAGVHPGQTVLLQLTHLHEICTVHVNGTLAGTIWAAPYQLDVTRYLRPGSNQLEIAVTNLWPNRIIGDLQPSAPVHYTHTNIRAYSATSPLLPSGLYGAVKLVTLSPGRIEGQ